MSQEEKETTFYSDDRDVRVTDKRLIVGNTMYAMANIASVSTALTKPSRRVPLVFIAIGALVFLASGGDSTGLTYGAILLAVGILWWKAQKSVYHLRISSASGQSTAVSSSDRSYVERIVQAVNEAIIKRA